MRPFLWGQWFYRRPQASKRDGEVLEAAAEVLAELMPPAMAAAEAADTLRTVPSEDPLEEAVDTLASCRVWLAAFMLTWPPSTLDMQRGVPRTAAAATLLAEAPATHPTIRAVVPAERRIELLIQVEAPDRFIAQATVAAVLRTAPVTAARVRPATAALAQAMAVPVVFTMVPQMNPLLRLTRLFPKSKAIPFT